MYKALIIKFFEKNVILVFKNIFELSLDVSNEVRSLTYIILLVKEKRAATIILWLARLHAPQIRTSSKNVSPTGGSNPQP
jgi:hypothetical protein